MTEVYDPSIFLVNSIDEAKRIILTDEGIGTNVRWEEETPQFVNLIEEHCQPAEDCLVLDYGCGIGRLSKPLIEQFHCNVVGVDISTGMRALASVYTNNGRFIVGSPNILNWLGLQFDFALTVWTLQHCYEPANDLMLIKQSLKPGGLLFVVNTVHRVVPVQDRKWINDGIDIANLLDQNLNRVISETLSDWTYYGVWRK